MKADSKDNGAPRLSVIMPVYNTSEFLEESIGSVLCQTFRDFELIAVDDGSTDNSLEICRRYEAADSRVRVLTQKNLGAGAARNKGAAHARAEYLMFLDSDDTAAPDMFAKAMEVMKEKDPDLLIFGYEEIFYSESGREKSRNERLPERLDLHTAADCRARYCGLVFDAMLNQPWNKVYKKSIIEKNDIKFPDVRRTQDALFNGEYFRRVNSLCALPEPLYCFRQNNKGRVWKKFPRDSYKIDVGYNSYLENILRDFGRYSGADRELADRWFFSSVYRDAGYYRNPYWALGRREKKEYVKKVISDDYIVGRAGFSLAPDKRSQRTKRRILDGDASGLMRDIRSGELRDSAYGFYLDKIRGKIRR